MENIRKNYPALSNFTYLNSCSSGLMSNALLHFRRDLDEQFQQAGSNFRAGVYKQIEEIKNDIARVFGAKPQNTTLIPSCSYGINLILGALKKGKKVLHLANDYPSIIWPFESRDFNCITIENQSYSESELIQHIKEHNAEVLAVSAVQYSNGEIIAPANFNAIKKAFPDLLILVDATQFWGISPFNFKESGIDLFIASAFKWLCAGYGNGAMFISDQLAAHLDSKIRGYNTYKNPRKEGTPSLGTFFEPGHQDLLVFKSLAFQVLAHEEIGYQNIQDQIKMVKTYARQEIIDKTPFQIKTAVNPHMESGILSVDAPKALVKHLNNNGIICSYNRGLRLGIHFYNNQEDIDLLVAAIRSFEA